jgi:Ser/Thr protein kinase RdoA (MazF antagonist)
MGPAIQDLWMLIGADPFQQCERLDDLLQGYEEFYSFPMQQVALIEPLRALRMLHYSAWLASRWEDPSFKHHFPWFAEVKYWEQQILQFKEQTSMLQADTTKQRLLNYF